MKKWLKQGLGKKLLFLTSTSAIWSVYLHGRSSAKLPPSWSPGKQTPKPCWSAPAAILNCHVAMSLLTAALTVLCRNSHSCGPNSETRRTTCPCNASEQGAMKLQCGTCCHYWESVPETRLKRQSSRAWVMTMDHLDRASEMSTASLLLHQSCTLHIMNLDAEPRNDHNQGSVRSRQSRHTMVEYSWGRKSTPASKSFASSHPKESMRKKPRKKWLEVQTAMKAACRIKASSNGENAWNWWKWTISDQWINEYEEWQSDMWWQVQVVFEFGKSDEFGDASS